MAQILCDALPDECLLVDSLVNRAAQLYAAYGDCMEKCNHPSGSCNDGFRKKSNCQNCPIKDDASHHGNCVGCCLECSEEVHFGKSQRNVAFRKEYNCQKLIYYYTCRYSWKYCSEIMYALENVDLSKYGSYSVLSLGCGQSSDLMAIERENRVDKKSISYAGYDINPLWQSIQKEITAYSRTINNMQCHFETTDVIDSLSHSSVGFANIIVMSYLLSSFPDSQRQDNATRLFDLIIEKILAQKGQGPVLIIMNDIDHNTKARDCFDTLIRKITIAGYHGTVTKRHFSDRSFDYHDDSQQYQTSVNKFTIPSDIQNAFNCAIKCTSAQCIIEVN